jgi:excisionase family DNA binding protein
MRFNPRMANATESHVSIWWTLDKAAAHVAMHPTTLRRAIWAGQLRHARVGGRRAIRLRPEWVDEWILATTTPVEQ